MDSIPHLRPVEPEDDKPNRSQSRSRPTRPLVTDRLKFDVTNGVLHTVGRLSGPQKRPVTGEQLGEALGLHPDSARLPLPFFKEAGFLTKSGRSAFVATDALLDYMRNEAVGLQQPEAIIPLKEAMARSWYWTEVAAVLHLGTAPKTEVVSTIMRAAGASPHHLPMVEGVLVWLEHVGLLHVDGNVVTTSAKAVAVPKPNMGNDQLDPSAGQAEFVLRLNLSLTREDLAALTPDQIAALSSVIQTIATYKSQ